MSRAPAPRKRRFQRYGPAEAEDASTEATTATGTDPKPPATAKQEPARATTKKAK